MLNIVFGRDNIPQGAKFYLNGNAYFNLYKQPAWFEDKFVQEFLYKIDKVKVLFQEALVNKYGQGISTKDISTGCKVLCDIYFSSPEIWFYGSSLGDNCVEFLMRIAETRPVNLCLEHYLELEEYNNSGKVMMNGVVIDEYAYCDAFDDYCEQSSKLD